jgi:hypothetical protein
LNKSILKRRYLILEEIARNASVKLYLEALPKEMCDFINSHKELVEFRDAIHVDFATMIINGEGVEFLKANIHKIERFHISIPGYSYNFCDYPEIINWTKFLFNHKVQGIIEIQNRSKDKDLVNELECLIRSIYPKF